MWRVVVGDVVQTVSGVMTTVGVLGALWVVILDEHRYRAEQRLARGDQARLVSLQFELADDFQHEYGSRGRSYVLGSVKNFSARPILDVEFDEPDDDPYFSLGNEGPLEEANYGKARVVDAGGTLTAMYSVKGEQVDWDRFRTLRVFFTDANGAPWSQTEYEPPVEMINKKPRFWKRGQGRSS